MSDDQRHHDSFEHEEELKKRDPDERSPEERRQDAGPEAATDPADEGILGSVAGARANKPTG